MDSRPSWRPLLTRRALYLDALLADGELVEVEDGSLDDVDRRQDGHTDVDGITPLRVQNKNLRLLCLSSFLHTSSSKEHH